MAPKRPTRIEAENLLQAQKVVTAKLKWKPAGKGWRLQAKVLALEIKETFEIRGVSGKTNYSFILLYRNYPIRKYTVHGPHKIGATIFSEPHKHVWDGETENREAYIPPDIDPKADINDQFLSFCNECNINILGEYQYFSGKI